MDKEVARITALEIAARIYGNSSSAGEVVEYAEIFFKFLTKNDDKS